MRRVFVLVVAAFLASPALAGAQGSAAQSAEPFKVGTFSNGASPWVGVVLRDRFVVDLSQANAALEKSRAFPRRAMPADMVALINDYESGLKGRIYAIVNDVVQSNALTGARPAYVREVTQVKTHAPIPRPRMIMNTAVNFYSHIAEGAPPEQRAQQIAARKANRGVPYMFLKAPSSVIGTGETILIPYGRTELDWEIEIATVIGRAARYVAAPKALDHVFGYTVMLDISDRGGRPPGGFTGVDWFVVKGQDAFGPVGPFIVPKECYGDPRHRLKQKLRVGNDRGRRSAAPDAAARGRDWRRHVRRRRHGHLRPGRAGLARPRRRDHGDDRRPRDVAAQGRRRAGTTARHRLVSAAARELPRPGSRPWRSA